MQPSLAMTVHDGVQCVRVTPMQRSSNRSVFVFVVDGLLIDTGCASAQRDLREFYTTSAKDIDQVVLTHSHEDHAGMAAWIVEHMQRPVYIHPNGVALCASKPDYGAYRQKLWGLRQPFRARPLPEQFRSRTHGWRALHTPGHADDHVVLLDEADGRLFCGDLFLAPKTKLIMRHESVPAIMRSLRLVLEEDFQTVFCSHNGPLHHGRRLLMKKTGQSGVAVRGNSPSPPSGLAAGGHPCAFVSRKMAHHSNIGGRI